MHFTICYNVNGGKMKKYTYTPKGVCSNKMTFILDGDIIKDLKVTNGCPGNLLGISSLIKDKNIDEVISRLENIKCGFKNTSCPDQIAKALIEYKKENL